MPSHVSRKLVEVILILSIFYIISSFHTEIRSHNVYRSEYLSINLQRNEDNESNRFKIVTPKNLGNLFGATSMKPTAAPEKSAVTLPVKEPETNEVDDYEEYDDDDEKDEYDDDDDENDANSGEDLALSSIEELQNEIVAMKDEEAIVKVEPVVDSFYNSIGMDYILLDMKLPQNRSTYVANYFVSSSAPVSYNSSAVSIRRIGMEKIYPGVASMMRGRQGYGVYQRVNGKRSKGKSRTGKTRKSSGMNGLMGTIRRLNGGNYPKGANSFGSSAFAEPPPGARSEVLYRKQPKKSTSKSGTQIISPNGISKMFKNAKDKGLTAGERQYGEVMTSFDDVFKKPGDSKSGSEESVEEVPKWLQEANAKAKRENSMKRKKKKLTEDWRFWMSIIGGAGLVTAVYNTYQQTGGFIGLGQGPEIVL